jgi:uncharacterized protein DUF3800
MAARPCPSIGKYILDESDSSSDDGDGDGKDPSSRIMAMVSGLPPAKRKGRLLMAYQAYFDDSGSSVPVFVLSGFVDPVSRWEKFSDGWQKLLDEPPRLKYFKMYEAAQLCGEFGRMGVNDRNERIQKFFRLISDTVHLSVSCIIPMKPFKRIWKGKMDGGKWWNDHYYLAIWDSITLLTETHVRMRMLELFATQEGNSPSAYGVLDFIFDDNPRLAAIVAPHYQRVRQEIKNPLWKNWIGASARFENDKDFLPLQACDAQSWYFRRLFAERFNNEPFKDDLPKSCFKALDEITSWMSFWSPVRMRKTIAKEPKEKTKVSHCKDIHDLLANGDFGETK